MKALDRRDALKLGALGLFGSACSAQRPSSAGTPASGGPAGLAGTSGHVVAEVGPPSRSFTLAFGSCNKPNLPQPLWAPIRAQRPDAWLWLGDIVYADTVDIDRTRSLYRQQTEQLDYAALVASTRVVGIWDDHDYGKNDAGREYPKRIESQAALLDFLREPKNSPRRARAGTYTSYEFGSGAERVKLILLDARYHREKPGPRSDTLGAAQWAWLEAELKSSTAALTIVTSGYQVLPEDHSNEKWGNFPRAHARLLELLRAPGVPGVILLSGDRHFSELSRVDDQRIGCPLYELTSSGMTHSYSNMVDEPNRHRVGKLYSKLNFGVVRIDWDRGDVALETRGRDGAVVIEQHVALARLARSA